MENILTLRIKSFKKLFRVASHDAGRPSGISIILLLGCSIVGLTHCSPKVSRSNLPLDSLKAFSWSGDQQPPEKWWTAFGDQKLNAMIEKGLGENFSLMTLWHRFEAAKAIADRESSYLLPDIEATLESGISRPQPDFVGGENVQLGLSAFYEIDLWGRIRASIKAEQFRAEATFADYQAAAITLSGEIADTWYNLMAEWLQLKLVEEQIETNEKMLTFIKAQFGSGQIRSVDILRQRQLLEATREQKIIIESAIKVLENQLAVLMGLPAQNEIAYSPGSLPDLPPLPATGIPTELIQRRPDVQRAFSLLKAADRDMAAAISNQYPRLFISTSLSVRANNINNLFEDWAYSLATNLLAPLWYGGRLSAEVERTEAVKNQHLYQYGQTILLAFQEVEDALIREKKQLERIRVLEEQAALARLSNEQLRIEYFNGMSDYLAVLTALTQEQQLRRDLISAKLNLLEYRIALYRALAGGFKGYTEDVP